MPVSCGRDCEAERTGPRGAPAAAFDGSGDVAGTGDVAERTGAGIPSGACRRSGFRGAGRALPVIVCSLALPNDMATWFEAPTARALGARGSSRCGTGSGESILRGRRGNDSCDVTELARVGGPDDTGSGGDGKPLSESGGPADKSFTVDDGVSSGGSTGRGGRALPVAAGSSKGAGDAVAAGVAGPCFGVRGAAGRAVTPPLPLAGCGCVGAPMGLGRLVTTPPGTVAGAAPTAGPVIGGRGPA